MLFVKMFGFMLAAAALFTSLAMMIMGGNWQRIEELAYAGNRRPWWFKVISVFLILLYVLALVNFIVNDKNWASWTLMVIIPVGWVIKAAAVVFNKEGRKKVSSISGDENWRKVALARLPIAIILAVLAIFA